jgi:cold shock CspA family protein
VLAEQRGLSHNQRMFYGTIKSLSDRGFGFIEPSGGGKDVYFHAADVGDEVFRQFQTNQWLLNSPARPRREASREKGTAGRRAEADRPDSRRRPAPAAAGAVAAAPSPRAATQSDLEAADRIEQARGGTW